MNTLEERIAEVLASEIDGRNTVDDLARAVVAVLPTADVSDAAAWEVVVDGRSHLLLPVMGPHTEALARQEANTLGGTARPLFDAQAAAHAAEIAKHEHKLRSLAEDMGLGPIDDRPLQELFSQGMRPWVGRTTAEVEALRAEVERHIEAVAAAARLVNDVEEEADADRDRAVTEALEQVLAACAWELHDGTTSDYEAGQRRAKDDLARIVRGLIAGPDLGVWTQEQVDSINERAARRAEAIAPLIDGGTDD